MRQITLLALFLGMAIPAFAQTQVRGHYRRDGSYVAPHTRTAPNRTNRDNYSTQPNRNPYNGNQGSRAPDYSPGAANYGQGHPRQTGPNGGQYYINSQGRKVYVPKQ